MKLFLDKNYIYLQTAFVLIGIVCWVLNVDQYYPKTFVIACSIFSVGLIVINVYKLFSIKSGKFKWGLNASWFQLIFYVLLVFLIYFRFFGSNHAGPITKIYALIVLVTLIIDTFTVEN